MARKLKAGESLPNAPIRALGYLRVSTDDQATGLQSQQDAITAYLRKRPEIELLEFMIDDGVSGGTLKRPALAAALRELNSGAANALIAMKMDRLSRSLADFCTLAAEAKRNKWRLIVLDADYDGETPQGEMMLNLLAVFGQYERRLIGQRTKDALAVKKREGILPGPKPRTTPPPFMVEVWARSHLPSYRMIAESLTRNGVPAPGGSMKWYPMTVKRLLDQWPERLTGK